MAKIKKECSLVSNFFLKKIMHVEELIVHLTCFYLSAIQIKRQNNCNLQKCLKKQTEFGGWKVIMKVDGIAISLLMTPGIIAAGRRNGILIRCFI